MNDLTMIAQSGQRKEFRLNSLFCVKLSRLEHHNYCVHFDSSIVTTVYSAVIFTDRSRSNLMCCVYNSLSHLSLCQRKVPVLIFPKLNQNASLCRWCFLWLSFCLKREWCEFQTDRWEGWRRTGHNWTKSTTKKRIASEVDSMPSECRHKHRADTVRDSGSWRDVQEKTCSMTSVLQYGPHLAAAGSLKT